MNVMSTGPALRASDADRDVVAEKLRTAAVEGRIDPEELEERLSQVYAARWVADLDRLVADVSPPPPPVPLAPPPYAYQPAVVYPTTNGLAIASLVAGLLWLAWFGSVLAVIFGHIAIAQIKKSGGRESGTGLAIGGLVLGYLGVATLLIALISSRA
jgi:hypothetical protein